MLFSRTSASPKAEAALALINRDHPTSLWCVNWFQHGHHFIHFWPLVSASIPTPLHHICQRTWATTRYLRSQILQIQSKVATFKDFFFLLFNEQKCVFKYIYIFLPVGQQLSSLLRSSDLDMACHSNISPRGKCQSYIRHTSGYTGCH